MITTACRPLHVDLVDFNLNNFNFVVGVGFKTLYNLCQFVGYDKQIFDKLVSAYKKHTSIIILFNDQNFSKSNSQRRNCYHIRPFQNVCRFFNEIIKLPILGDGMSMLTSTLYFPFLLLFFFYRETRKSSNISQSLAQKKLRIALNFFQLFSVQIFEMLQNIKYIPNKKINTTTTPSNICE